LAEFPLSRVNDPLSRVNDPLSRVNDPLSRVNDPLSRVNDPLSRVNDKESSWMPEPRWGSLGLKAGGVVGSGSGREIWLRPRERLYRSLGDLRLAVFGLCRDGFRMLFEGFSL